MSKIVLVVEDDASTRRLVAGALENAGITVTSTSDGSEAMERIRRQPFDLILLDLTLPGLGGLEILERIQQESIPAKVVVMTGDDAPHTVLCAVRRQAMRYILKPFSTKTLTELVQGVLTANHAPAPIEVISAIPEWVELLVPCDMESAERIRSFMESLSATLPQEVRDSIGQAFRELLLNAIEWGGKFDASRKVRISCLRTRRMLLYRIADPGPGFRLEALTHSALNNPLEAPLRHVQVREEMRLRPGGFGILLVKSMVDELLFNEAHNEVVFVKYLD